MALDRDPASLFDMVESARLIVEFVRGKTFQTFLADRMLRSAVERQVEIIGEAARRVSDAFQEAHPEIPWRPIIAQRHILAHDYDIILEEQIWRVATIHAPALILLIEPLLPPMPESQ